MKASAGKGARLESELNMHIVHSISLLVVPPDSRSFESNAPILRACARPASSVPSTAWTVGMR